MQKRLAELEMLVAKQNGSETSPHSRQMSTDNSYIGSPGQSESEPHAVKTPSTLPAVSRRQDDDSCGSGQLLGVLRELSVGALGEYMGATSQLTMSRVIASMIRLKDEKSSMSDEECGRRDSRSWDQLSPKSANPTTSRLDGQASLSLRNLSPSIADKLLRGYIVHISTRWPVMHTPYIRQLHETRDDLVDTYEITALHLVYAIGGRFLETAGETGEFQCEQHFERAIANLDEIIQRHAGLRSIQILILLSLYNLRSPRGPGAWTFCGLAMRQSIELGLHRQTRVRWPLIDEMRRRVFWTCYCLDRQVSIILGRPFAISDKDIDVELPTDVEEHLEDMEELQVQQAEARCNSLSPPLVSSSMTGFIYICHLRMIESDIQQTIYRVDKVPPSMKADVEKFITRLEQWKAQMPLDARKLPDFDKMKVDGYDNYVHPLLPASMVYYYKCMRFLLYPVILSSEIADVHFLKKCAEACAGVCRTYKKLHQAVPVGFSVMALHSIFIAGLTLLYCIWAAPRDIFSIASSNALNACSIVMYVIAERWVGARKYRDVFDVIKQAVMESIEAGADEPRRSITNLRDDVLTTLRTAGSSDKACGGEFSALVSDMSGIMEVAGDAESDAVTLTGRDSQRQPLDEPQMQASDSQGVTPTALNFLFPPEGIPFDSMMFGFPSVDDAGMVANGIGESPQDGWNGATYAQYSRSL